MEAPHRTLKLATPYMRGEDVKAFQIALNGHLHHYARFSGIPDEISEDGEYGPDTRRAYWKVGWYVVGFLHETLEHGATVAAQRGIRNTAKLNPSQRARAAERKKSLKEEPKGGARAVLRAERVYLGRHEGPGNRSGPNFPVDTWEREVGMLGEPYCGIAQTYFIRHFGGVAVPSLAYTPNIYGWARQDAHGLYLRHWDTREPGNLILYKWAGVSHDFCDHVGMLDEDRDHTIEFNTSSGTGGSQNNGGGCYRRERGSGNVVAVVGVKGL